VVTVGATGHDALADEHPTALALHAYDVAAGEQFAVNVSVMPWTKLPGELVRVQVGGAVGVGVEPPLTVTIAMAVLPVPAALTPLTE
jgi:hypothetical protein